MPLAATAQGALHYEMTAVTAPWRKAGRTLLQITLQRLASFGIRDFIVNAHHFADAIVEYLQENHNFGLRIEISREEELLDTGGGLKKARWERSGSGLWPS